MPMSRVWKRPSGIWCAVGVSSRLGNFVAYVGLPEGHPLHGIDYTDRSMPGFDVHGGLTYSGEGEFIKSDGPALWWIGIDFAHAGDFVESGLSRFFEFQSGGRKWTEDEVAAEVDRLAEQVEALPCP